MFDVGFQELALISIIALIVVGPERLPKMARTVGLWAGKIRYYVGQVKNDIEREVRAQELKEMLDKPAGGLDDLYKVAEETKGALDEAKAGIESVPTGIPTPDEPAAGSIFPPGLPDTGADPAPADSAPAAPAVTEPAAEAAPAAPAVTEPAAEPVPAKPAAAEPAPAEPVVTEPAPKESANAAPTVTDPATTRPPETG